MIQTGKAVSSMVKTGMIPYADMVPKAVLTEMQNQMAMLQASLKKIKKRSEAPAHSRAG